MLDRSFHRITRSPAGQGLVEFALILLVILIIAFGVMDLARVFHSTVVITNAAREGARFGSQYPDCLTVQLEYCPSTAEQTAIDEADASGIVLTTGQITAQLANSNTAVQVTVTYTFETIIGGFFAASPLDITREATMYIMVTQ